MEPISLKLFFLTLGFFIPLVVSLLVAFRTPKPETDGDFYLTKLTTREYITTSIGYGLQVASIFLFLYWSFSYGVVVLFIPIAWYLGYHILSCLFKEGKLDSFLLKTSQSRDRDQGQKLETIHSYVAGEKDFLSIIFALVTVVGLGGTFIAEIDYTTSFLTNVFDNAQLVGLSWETASGGWGIEYLTPIMIFFSCSYVIWGGYKAVIRTDAIQVPIAYTSLLASVVLYGISSDKGNNIFLYSVFFLLICIAIARFILFESEDSSNGRCEKLIFPFLGGVFSFLLVYYFSDAEKIDFDAMWETMLPDQGNGNFLGFGVLGVVSLIVVNSIWQLVDISSMQRLQSIDFSEEISHEKRIVIFKSIRLAGLETALMWSIITIFGLFLSSTGVKDYFTDLPQRILSFDGYVGYLMPFFISFFFSVFMLSTVDGFISAISMIVKNDIIENSPLYGLLKKRSVVVILAVFLIYALYIWLNSEISGSNIGAVLYAIYSFQVTLFPMIIWCILFKKSDDKISACACILSILVGTLLAIVTSINDPMFSIVSDSWYVLPPFASFLGSSLIFFPCNYIMRKIF